MIDNFQFQHCPPLEDTADQFMSHVGKMMITNQLAGGESRISPWLRLFQNEPRPTVFSVEASEPPSMVSAQK